MARRRRGSSNGVSRRATSSGARRPVPARAVKPARARSVGRKKPAVAESRSAHSAAGGAGIVRVGLVQMRCEADVAANLARAERHVRTAARRGAQIVCLPELFRSLYFCQREDHDHFDLAEPIPGPTHRGARQARPRARHRRSSPRCSSGARPASTTTPPSCSTPTARSLGTYRKMHIPDDPLYYEKFYFTPGDLGFRRSTTPHGRSRHAGLLGPVVSGGGAADGARRARRSSSTRRRSAGTRARRPSTARRSTRPGRRCSAATRSPTACSSRSPNRVGHEGPVGGAGIEFWGQSFVVDPFGRVVARAERRSRRGAGRHRAISARVETARTHWPFLRDRRIDAYGELTAPLHRREARAT